MPESRRISPRVSGVYRGSVFSVSERPPDRVMLRREGVPDQEVAIADLDEWYTVRTYGTFLDHRFEVYSEEDGEFFIGVVGKGDGHWLADTWAKPEEHPDVHFQQMDRFTYEALVPKHMVTDIHEVRTDHPTTEGNR